MALDRQSIEKKDFPIGRRGYDPDAVDAHLGRIADEVEELGRAARRRSETLASAASEQVRTIVEAAERSAAEIQRQAEEEAREIRAEASSEAQQAREQTDGQAREYLAKLSESTAAMLKDLEAMQIEIDALFESLRTGSGPPQGEALATSAASERTSGSSDAEGARLIALNMALNGTPRDEAERYLKENFQLTDGRRLLDEVYASVEG